MDHSWLQTLQRRNNPKTGLFAVNMRKAYGRYLGTICDNLSRYEALRDAGLEAQHPYPYLPSLIFGSSTVAAVHLQAAIDWDYQMMTSEWLFGDDDVAQSRYGAADHLDNIRRPYNKIMAVYAKENPQMFDVRRNNYLDGLLPSLSFSVGTASPLAPVPQADLLETAQAIHSAYMEYSTLVQESQWFHDDRKYEHPTVPIEIYVFLCGSFHRDYFMAVHQQEAARILKRYHGLCWG